MRQILLRVATTIVCVLVGMCAVFVAALLYGWEWTP